MKKYNVSAQLIFNGDPVGNPTLHYVTTALGLLRLRKRLVSTESNGWDVVLTMPGSDIEALGGWYSVCKEGYVYVYNKKKLVIVYVTKQ